MHRILAGTDFSPASDSAIRTAASWARRKGAALRIVHVVPPKRWLRGSWRLDLRTASDVHRHAGEALKRVVETLDPSRELDISTGLISGAASVQLTRGAHEFGADLLVIGARGEHATAARAPALGGTSLKLLSRTSVPLLLVRNDRAGDPASVLAAVDLSAVSKEVLAWSYESIASRGNVTVFHAYEVPFAARLNMYGVSESSIDIYSEDERKRRQCELDALVSAPAPSEVSTRTVIERVDPIDGLFRHVQELDPDLVVVGKSTGRGRRRRSNPAGSVSRHTALFAPANVLIVPEPGQPRP